MKILISGICGFAGSTLAKALKAAAPAFEIFGFDNFIRPGSELNRVSLRQLGIAVSHGDLRFSSDIEALPAADYVIDAAANPSILAGVDGKTSSRQLLEHNLAGTVNLLEYCKTHKAGFVLLSTSRVYAIDPLARLPMKLTDGAFCPDSEEPLPYGLSCAGISEDFSTTPPISLYGGTKLASEILALEYGATFGFPVWINRCGVLAGAGQFGRADQGIFSFWIHSYLHGQPLKYIGFGGLGHQVRDCLHPSDLVPLLVQQMSTAPGTGVPQIVNLGGGTQHAMSLAQLTAWCESRFGHRQIEASAESRPYDIPWIVMDSSLARKTWDWKPQRSLESILSEIADHAVRNPGWLELSKP